MEVDFPPAPLPPPIDHGDGRGPISIVETRQLGIQLEVPADALAPGTWSAPEAPRVSMRTLAPGAVEYLREGADLGETPFSPIVRIDFPVAGGGAAAAAAAGRGGTAEMAEAAAPEIRGTAREAPFARPLTLVMPHCFSPDHGGESCVLLGAPHGALAWQRLHVVDSADDLERRDVAISAGEMRVAVPFAGIFCAFSSREVADLAACRFRA